MGRTAYTEPQCLYRGALYLYFILCFALSRISAFSHKIYLCILMILTAISGYFCKYLNRLVSIKATNNFVSDLLL